MHLLSESASLIHSNKSNENNQHRLMSFFVLTSIPALMVGLWNIGYQTFSAMEMSGLSLIPNWQNSLLNYFNLPYNKDNISVCLLFGILHFLPLLLISFVVCQLWDGLFAKFRHRSMERGNFFVSWFFVLLLPINMPLPLLILGSSFGQVFGKLIFGGAGKYLVHPSLLGVVFLYYSYPSTFDGSLAVVSLADFSGQSSWSLLAQSGTKAMIDNGSSWLSLFMGNELGLMGSVSALFALLGGLVLSILGFSSWRIILGAILGVAITVWALQGVGEGAAGQIPWFWHLAVGSFVFGVSFLATDPAVSPSTHKGRWFYGVLIGFLTVLIRVANPSHPESTLQALLLASLFAPLIDSIVLYIRNAKQLKGSPLS